MESKRNQWCCQSDRQTERQTGEGGRRGEEGGGSKMANQEEMWINQQQRQVAKQPESQSASQSAGKFGGGLVSGAHSRGDAGSSGLPHKMCHQAPPHPTSKSETVSLKQGH